MKIFLWVQVFMYSRYENLYLKSICTLWRFPPCSMSQQCDRVLPPSWVCWYPQHILEPFHHHWLYNDNCWPAAPSVWQCMVKILRMQSGSHKYTHSKWTRWELNFGMSDIHLCLHVIVQTWVMNMLIPWLASNSGIKWTSSWSIHNPIVHVKLWMKESKESLVLSQSTRMSYY